MLNILIVDDSMIIRRNIRKIFEEVGDKIVAEAKNGIEACSQYKNTLPDLVTMDITMPDMDGITAVKKIIEEYPNAKIVMITSHGQENMVIDAVKAGAKGYILKPLSKDKILESVESIFGVKRKDIEEVKKEEPIKTKKKDKLDFFRIENRSGIFIVRVKTAYKSIDKEIMLEIEEYIENLFIIKPLNIVFNFEGILEMSNGAMNTMFGLIKKLNKLEVTAKLYIPSVELKDALKLSYQNNHKSAKLKLVNSIN